jgi:hypothetical protein
MRGTARARSPRSGDCVRTGTPGCGARPHRSMWRLRTGRSGPAPYLRTMPTRTTAGSPRGGVRGQRDVPAHHRSRVHEVLAGLPDHAGVRLPRRHADAPHEAREERRLRAGGGLRPRRLALRNQALSDSKFSSGRPDAGALQTLSLPLSSPALSGTGLAGSRRCPRGDPAAVACDGSMFATWDLQEVGLCNQVADPGKTLPSTARGRRGLRVRDRRLCRGCGRTGHSRRAYRGHESAGSTGAGSCSSRRTPSSSHSVTGPTLTCSPISPSAMPDVDGRSLVAERGALPDQPVDDRPGIRRPGVVGRRLARQRWWRDPRGLWT